MSMPQYIEIAVVASNEEGFKPIEGIGALTKSGIAPRYKLATIHRPKSPGVTQLDHLPTKRIGLWVALDDESMDRCQKMYAALSSRPGYTRGFYDGLLPVAVVRIEGRREFEVLTKKVMDAFCETS